MSATLKQIVEELFPLHRTLASEGTDRALELLERHLPAEADYEVETFAPGEPVWTWQVPARYVVHEAYLETEDGRRIADFHDNPMHLVSYSVPVDDVLHWDELEPHLHYAEARPSAIPWVFKYYQRTWGFCISKETFEALPRDARYSAVIRSEFRSDAAEGMRVGVATVEPAGGAAPEAGEMIVCAHICHPHQANDDLSGVASAVGLARRLAVDPLPPGSMTVRFLFCPETIGSIAYLSHHEDLIPRLRGGIFSEMTGNDNSLVLQRTRQDDHRLDRIARAALAQVAGDFREGPFRRVIINDEFVINGPGVNVPCISLSRFPYDEYHTSDDNPDIIGDDRLEEAAATMEEIVRAYATDYVPRRTFKGPVFLSGYGLWVDSQEGHLAIDEIMLRLEGDRSIADIAVELDLPYATVRGFVESLREHGLVEVLGDQPATRGAERESAEFGMT